MGRSPDQLVKDFLRGQNLEQLGRVEEAISLYEGAVQSGFDASGPYDRLIWIYQSRKRHEDVVRIAEASLAQVKTHPAKREWYAAQISQARRAIRESPRPRPRGARGARGGGGE